MTALSSKMAKNSKPRKACDADDLKRFYDREYWERKATMADPKQKSQLGYDPSKSWDGLSQTGEVFERLIHCFTVNNPTHQIGIAGARVLEMEPTPPGGIFGTGVGSGEATDVPMTVEQLDCKKVFQRGVGQGEIAVTREQHLEGTKLSSTEVNVVSVPEFVRRAGPSADQFPMLPKGRRDIMQLERENRLAIHAMRKAVGDKQRLLHLMKARYPGILGVDSTANHESPVYGHVAQESAQREQRKSEKNAKRRAYLEAHTSWKSRVGINPLEHSESLSAMEGVKPGQVKKIWDSKRRPGDDVETSAGSASQPSHHPMHDTHRRLFNKEPVHHNNLRSQRLLDTNSRGRTYNIINNCDPGDHFRPSYRHEANDTWRDSNQAHPSQNSLERGRNLQGHVQASWRITSPLLDPAY